MSASFHFCPCCGAQEPTRYPCCVNGFCSDATIQGCLDAGGYINSASCGPQGQGCSATLYGYCFCNALTVTPRNVLVFFNQPIKFRQPCSSITPACNITTANNRKAAIKSYWDVAKVVPLNGVMAVHQECTGTLTNAQILYTDACSGQQLQAFPSTTPSTSVFVWYRNTLNSDPFCRAGATMTGTGAFDNNYDGTPAISPTSSTCQCSTTKNWRPSTMGVVPACNQVCATQAEINAGTDWCVDNQPWTISAVW